MKTPLKILPSPLASLNVFNRGRDGSISAGASSSSLLRQRSLLHGPISAMNSSFHDSSANSEQVGSSDSAVIRSVMEHAM